MISYRLSEVLDERRLRILSGKPGDNLTSPLRLGDRAYGMPFSLCSGDGRGEYGIWFGWSGRGSGGVSDAWLDVCFDEHPDSTREIPGWMYA